MIANISNDHQVQYIIQIVLYFNLNVLSRCDRAFWPSLSEYLGVDLICLRLDIAPVGSRFGTVLVPRNENR